MYLFEPTLALLSSGPGGDLSAILLTVHPKQRQLSLQYKWLAREPVRSHSPRGVSSCPVLRPCRVIVPDLPAHGARFRETPLTLDNAVDTLHEVIQKEAARQKVGG
jgi:hypothetical protein